MTNKETLLKDKNIPTQGGGTGRNKQGQTLNPR
jgi:hypothetical protein